MRLSSRVRAGARALTTPTRDLHRLEHEQHLTVITINQLPPVSSADLADSAFTTCARVHTPAAEWQTWACVDADTNFRRREVDRTSGGSGASEIRGGGSGSGKGSPAFTGQAILLFCRMRRGAHVPGRSQDHLRMNGVEKRQGGGGGPVSAPFKCTASARDNIVGSGRRPRSTVCRSLGPECPAFE